MWRILSESVIGVSHEREDGLCQDFCVAREIRITSGDILVAACSDGAGSASHSQLGSQLACESFITLVTDLLEEVDDLSAVEQTQLAGILSEIQQRIQDCAEKLSIESRQLACTFLAGLVGPEEALFLQIGDGAIVICEDTEYLSVFWPQSGEYANTTNFLTQTDMLSHLEFARTDKQIDRVSLFTDGLERLALDFQTHTVHQPFLSPMFEAMEASNEDFSPALREFLGSSRINDRTDDDKSLVLATRRTVGP